MKSGSRFNVVFCVLTVAALSPAVFAANDKPVVERGRYLVQSGGCTDCHTPMVMTEAGPAPDLAREFSGHPEGAALPPPPPPGGPWIWGGSASMTAFWGPWGISYATNITGDPATGIGNWKADDFVKAMKSGKHLGAGRPILPPMPWQSLGMMDDRDLRAMFAYLKSTRPVRNKVPEPQINPPPR